MIHNVSDFTHREGTEVIGDTTFVNGSPRSTCGNCGAMISLIDHGYTVATPGKIIKGIGRGKQEHPIERRLHTHMIIIGTKRPDDEYLLAPDPSFGHKTLSVKTKWHHQVSQVPACESCWSEQQRQIAAKRQSDNPDGIVFYWKRRQDDRTKFVMADLHDFAVRIGWCIDYLPSTHQTVEKPSRKHLRNLAKLKEIAQIQSQRLKKNRRKPFNSPLKQTEPTVRISGKHTHTSNLSRQTRSMDGRGHK